MREVNGVAIYTRVSSKKQNVDLPVSAQLKALRGSSRNGYTMVKEYVYETESRQSTDGLGFKQMVVAPANRTLAPHLV